MASDTARRGRPRGSGLDDRAQLRRISQMLEADPNLKPTTAIKAIGVSDPSTIRRLRDKLRAGPQCGSHGAPSGAFRGRLPELIEARPASKPARTERPSGAPASGGLEMHPAAVSEAQASWFAQWCMLGLSAVSSTVEAQMAMMDDFLRVPQVASALRHQLLFNEMAKAFCPRRSDVRSTLH